MKQLQVTVPEVKSGSYDIVIDSEILSDVWPRLEKEFGPCNKFVVTGNFDFEQMRRRDLMH